MKILYTCTYSAGISGVWNRVYNVAQEMIKRGHKVYVFSSNLEAGTGKKVKDYERVDGIEAYRFKVKSFGSKNAYLYDIAGLKERFLKVKPDIVDCQTYRHEEGTVVLEEAGKLGIPCVLTTHAPFVSVGVRGLFLSFGAWLYDFMRGGEVLSEFKKIIAITKWEYPYLNKLGVKNEKIIYIPNGIPSEFFRKNRKFGKEVRKILFFGRVAPVKDIKTLLRAWAKIEKLNANIVLEITGPVDGFYDKKLKRMTRSLGLRNVKFKPAVFELKKKIETYNDAEVFVLPSKREGMPQSLIEAMACGNIVIASDIEACRELVKEGKIGYLFRQGDAEDLAEKIKEVIRSYRKMGKVQKNAVKFASGFKWKTIADRLEKVYKGVKN